MGDPGLDERSPVLASAEDVSRDFGHFSEVSEANPVVVTRDGRPANVLLSLAEYERLKARDQLAFRAEDTPDRFLDELERLRKTLDESETA